MPPPTTQAAASLALLLALLLRAAAARAACVGRPKLSAEQADSGNLVFFVTMPDGTADLASLRYRVLGDPQLGSAPHIDLTTAGSRRADGTVRVPLPGRRDRQA